MSIAASAFVAAGCATGRIAVYGEDLHRIEVNGEEVATAGNESLLEVLQRKATAFRLGEQAPSDDRPSCWWTASPCGMSCCLWFRFRPSTCGA